MNPFLMAHLMYLFWSIQNVIIFFSWIHCLSQYIHSDNLLFQCTAPSMWLTNWCTDPSTWLTHQLKKDVGCKVLQFIHTMKIKKLLGHKTLRRTNAATSSRERWTRACHWSQYSWIIPLHQIASRTVRKETLYKYTLICMKSNLKNWFL